VSTRAALDTLWDTGVNECDVICWPSAVCEGIAALGGGGRAKVMLYDEAATPGPLARAHWVLCMSMLKLQFMRRATASHFVYVEMDMLFMAPPTALYALTQRISSRAGLACDATFTYGNANRWAADGTILPFPRHDHAGFRSVGSVNTGISYYANTPQSLAFQARLVARLAEHAAALDARPAPRALPGGFNQVVIDEMGFASILPNRSRTVNGTTVCALDYYALTVPDLFADAAPGLNQLCKMLLTPPPGVLALHFNGDKVKKLMLAVHSCWAERRNRKAPRPASSSAERARHDETLATKDA